jgi:hypothetical protein
VGLLALSSGLRAANGAELGSSSSLLNVAAVYSPPFVDQGANGLLAEVWESVVRRAGFSVGTVNYSVVNDPTSGSYEVALKDMLDNNAYNVILADAVPTREVRRLLPREVPTLFYNETVTAY